LKVQIKKLRESAGLTQFDLAKLLGFESPSTISMWESGARKPQSDKLPELARVLGCTIDELFKQDEPKSA